MHTRTNTCNRTRSTIVESVGVFLATTTLAIIGCGTASILSVSGTGNSDRDTLPSTIIEDDTILASGHYTLGNYPD